jgi:predicted MPP superfamily phosphohydrolase
MMRRIVFFLLPVLAIFGVVSFYLGWHGTYFLHLLGADVPPALYWIVFYLVTFSYLLGRLPLRPRPLFRLFKVIGSYYFAILEFGLILLILADLAAGIAKLSGAFSKEFAIVCGFVVLGLLVLLLAWGSRNAWSPIVRRYEIQVDKPAGNLKQLKLAIVSDIHLGNVVGNRHLDRLLPLVNDWQPDVTLLAGDVIDDTVEPFMRRDMSGRLARLHAKYGVFAVLGNHEYYGGHIPEYVEKMRRIGIPVLQDETVTVGGAIQIAGRKDKTAESMDPQGRMPIAELVSSFDDWLPIIVMDHQPTQYDLAAAAGVDILVSGHTHRGQMAPNHWITRRMFELDWGYLRKKQMHAFVSSGFGTWGPPIRLASRSEIIQVTVRFKGDTP